MNQKDTIMLGHGSGGALSSQLLDEVIFRVFRDVQPTDGAVLSAPPGKQVVFTTDSFVVKPLFFNGGNIGKIAVNGTINDLAMMGAQPAHLAVGLIIEEGFKISDLTDICTAMKEAADQAGVSIVAGDTKVVGKGEADSIFINTSGIGYVAPEIRLNPANIGIGDAVIVSGGLGEHSTAVFGARMGVTFQPPLESDSSALWENVNALLQGGIVPKVLRDITRGGLATVLTELVAGKKFDLSLTETKIPTDPRVKRACDIWGFDPLHMACEGRFTAIVPKEQAEHAVEILRQLSNSKDAAVIGEVVSGKGQVLIHTSIGGKRPISPLPGELLPRIC